MFTGALTPLYIQMNNKVTYLFITNLLRVTGILEYPFHEIK